jgi:AbrB family looped-hinge helix DNA binding protein
MKCEMSIEDNFYGAATVGERGQVVIPAEARKKFGINPGDKILVLAHPGGSGIMLCKIDAMRELFAGFLEDLSRIESKVEGPGIEEK